MMHTGMGAHGATSQHALAPAPSIKLKHVGKEVQVCHGASSPGLGWHHVVSFFVVWCGETRLTRIP